ncbi:MAG: hypothetical protein ACTSYZ_01010 [Candidatus Helarchaeota archaeon]
MDKSSKYSTYIILFYAVYGLLLMVVGRFNIQITFLVPISEGLGYTQFFSTQISLSSIIELIFNTPLIIIFFYLIYSTLDSMPNEKELKYANLLKLITLLLIGITILGVGIHFTANLFNEIKTQPTSPDPKDVLIYWLDEILGHHLIHSGIFGFFIMIMIFEYYKDQGQMIKLDRYSIPIWGFLIGAGFGIALAEGQCSKTFLIIYIISIIVILILKKYKYHFSFKEKRLVWFNIFFFIGNIISIISYGILSVALGYAFFSQPHLVF